MSEERERVMCRENDLYHLPDNLDDLKTGKRLEPKKDSGELEVRVLWLCSYCEYLTDGGEANEAGTVGSHLFFDKYEAPQYRVHLMGEARAGIDSEIVGVCDACSQVDGLGLAELSHMDIHLSGF